MQSGDKCAFPTFESLFVATQFREFVANNLLPHCMRQQITRQTHNTSCVDARPPFLSYAVQFPPTRRPSE